MDTNFFSKLLFKKSYDGKNNNLLTAGLTLEEISNFSGKEKFVFNEKPHWDDYRVRNILYSYFSTVPLDKGNNCGGWFVPRFYNIAGKEFIGVCDDGTGKHNVMFLLQIPNNFMPGRSGLIVAPTSNSLGIYGALGTIGSWALSNGWAVVYHDKGAGVGIHDLDTNHVFLLDGQWQEANIAGKNSTFTAFMANSERINFSNHFPHRIAFKHAHSQINQEKYWGIYTLEAVKFSFQVLSSLGVGTFNKENTIVIAAGMHNAGKACLAALEQDKESLIKGAVVASPNVALPPMRVKIVDLMTNEEVYVGENYSIIDYLSLQAIYQPCVNLGNWLKSVPFNYSEKEIIIAKKRCQSLFEKGLLKANTLDGQILEARKKILDYGISPEQEFLQAQLINRQVHEAILLTYANSYGRFSVLDRFAEASFAAIEEKESTPQGLKKEELFNIFADGNGIFPSNKIKIINDNSIGGAKELRVSTSANGYQDMGLDVIINLRNTVVGWDIVEKRRLTGESLAYHQRIRDGQQETWLTGNLQGKPVIMLVGTADQLISPNHAGRAYAILNKQIEGEVSKLSYIEVRNAQNDDSLLRFPQFAARFLPLLGYVHESLNWLVNHLVCGSHLPPSQTIETIQRGMAKDGVVPHLTRVHTPPIVAIPKLPIYPAGETLAINK